MNSFYSAKWENIFNYTLKIKLLIKYPKQFLTIVHIVIHDGSNNCYITQVWNIAFKTSKPLWKIWKYKINVFYILNKTKLKGEKKVHRTR